MATLFLEPGGDADYGTTLWGSVVGSPAVSSTHVHGGHTRALHFPTGANFVIGPANLSDAGGRISAWVFIAAYPSGITPIITTDTSGGSIVLEVALDSSGDVILGNGSSQIGSTGPTLSLNTWYQIALTWTITSSSVNQYAVFVNNASVITASNTAPGATGTNKWGIGNVGADGSLDFYASDIYVDNSNTVTDPGKIWVTAKRPLSNGTTNNFATNGTSSGYGTGNASFVNRRPLVTTDFVSVTPTTVKTDEYTIEGKSVGDIDISSATIVDFMGWMNSTIASTSNSPVMKIIVAGTSTTKTLTTSFVTYTQVAGSTTYPAGGTDIGMSAQYTTTGHLVKMDGCGLVVAYIPNSSQTITPSLVSTTPTIHAPTIGKGAVTARPNLVTTSRGVYVPTTKGVNTLLPLLVSHAPSTYLPALKGIRTILPAFLSRTVTLYGPTMSARSTITPALVSRSPAVYVPTVKGLSTLAPSFISRSAIAYVPALSAIYTITPAFTNRTATVYEAQLTGGPVTITPSLLASTPTVYDPGVSVGGVIIMPAFVSRSADTYAPTISSSVTILQPAVVHGPSVYLPTIHTTYDIEAPFVTRSPSLYEPTVESGSVTIAAPFIPRSSSVHSPTITTLYIITPVKVSRTATVYAVILTARRTITPPFVTSNRQVYSPQVIGEVTLTPDLVSSLPTVYLPSIFIARIVHRSIPIMLGQSQDKSVITIGVDAQPLTQQRDSSIKIGVKADAITIGQIEGPEPITIG